ncbi:WGR domain-containing protein [Tenacibaculum salmonis]|uniref:WGR domain-containing protein n=1 Tax=Tenacibaculum sp. P3-BQ1 TaxID=3232310 RepID=UPI0034DF5D7F
MKHLEKHLILKENENINFCIISFKDKTYTIVNGILGQKSTIEITHFDDNKTAEETIKQLITSKTAQGYKEEIQPNDISVFSIAMENLKTEDATQFENRLLTLKKLTGIYYTEDKHPFVQFLGIKMKDESFVTTPILDEYLKKHINEVSTSALVAVVQMTLQNIYFNFKATDFAVEEIIKRKDINAQLAIVAQFFEACEYYDAGHRFWSNTNQDKLIDNHFPKFQPEALLKLLEELPTDMLSGEDGDAMELLFIPALNNTDNQEIQQNILIILETYKKEYEEEGYVEDDYFEGLFEEISDDASDYVIKGLEQIEERKKKLT